MKERIVVTRSEYVTSAVGMRQYPSVRLPEIAFIGRSNVGKSSLINSLLHRKNLAHISQTPGKTQTINFFKVELKIAAEDPKDGNDQNIYAEDREFERKTFYAVDLPGYGYAKASKTKRVAWSKFISEYFLHCDRLLFVCQLIDMRHPPTDSDLDMFRWLVRHEVPVLVIATKSDKLSRTAQEKQLDMIKTAFAVDELDILPYSSIKNEGRSELLDAIANSLLQ